MVRPAPARQQLVAVQPAHTRAVPAEPRCALHAGRCRTSPVYRRREHFGKWFGRLPEVAISPCCSEFVATRAAIQRLPRAFYEETLRWMESSAMQDPGWIFEVRRGLQRACAAMHAQQPVPGQAAGAAQRLPLRHPHIASLRSRPLPQYMWQIIFSADHGAIWPWGFMPNACRCYLYNASCEAALEQRKWEFTC